MIKIKKIIKSESGFTLIELLVVIGIIAILATIGAVNFSSARGKARDAKRLADINQIQQSIEADAAGSVSGLFPLTWPAETAGVLPSGNTAYCYYINASPSATAYTVMVNGMEVQTTADSDGNPSPVAMLATPATKTSGSGTCVATAQTAAQMATACAAAGTYCKIGGTAI